MYLVPFTFYIYSKPSLDLSEYLQYKPTDWHHMTRPLEEVDLGFVNQDSLCFHPA